MTLKPNQDNDIDNIIYDILDKLMHECDPSMEFGTDKTVDAAHSKLKTLITKAIVKGELAELTKQAEVSL